MPRPSFTERALRRAVISAVGVGSYLQLGVRNSFTVSGREHLDGLPDKNVLFVANHQTYFLDVMAIFHAISHGRASPLAGVKSRLNLSFVAAHETMKERGLLPKIFAAGGAVCVKRTWRDGEKEVSRPLESSDLFAIGRALNSGWLITFPQGTTKAGAPGRRGTAHMIEHHKPVVVPVVVSGFREAFDKTGLKARRPGSELKLQFKAPLEFADLSDIDGVLAQVMHAIEQGPEASAKLALG
ncbi:MAG: 1-acyl-sn-glycerol-3-phosphate acyltransferase [Deltaproteobacteria bacterium]|nr:1-acyl-sn-glycerol-3-phosphate acyltransferase [Deltaproteobacteria bacterium]